jgi:hypothetical protein
MKTQNLFILLLSIITLAGCTKDDFSGPCTVRDYYTNEPIPNFSMSFKVCTSSSGSGIFGGKSCEEHKYNAISDSKGSFTLKVNSSDAKKGLTLEGTEIPVGSDSTNIHWQYAANDDQIYKSVLKVKPSGMLMFTHPVIDNSNTLSDTISVTINNQTLSMNKSQWNTNIFYVVPNRLYSVEITYINNGVKTNKTITITTPTAYQVATDYKSWGNGSVHIKIPEQ